MLPVPVEHAATDVDHVEAMHRALMATPPNTAWLVSTGTLTNIALAFQKYPDLAAHIKGLSIMGGAVGGGFTDAPMGTVQGEGERFGNWTPYAEFNVCLPCGKLYMKSMTNSTTGLRMHCRARRAAIDTNHVQCDPEASHFIFSHPVLRPKTTLIPLDLTHQVLGTNKVRKMLLYGQAASEASDSKDDFTPTPLRALFTQVMSFFAGTYADVFSITQGPPLHDPLAVVAAYLPEIFDDHGGERFTIDIVTTGIHSPDKTLVGELGRTKVTKLPSGEPGCRIPRSVDLDAFWRIMESALQRADAVSPLPKVSLLDLEREGVFDGVGRL